MGRLDFALGMRLHFLVFAALQNTPFVALPYAGKVSGFLEDLKLPAPPLNLVNPGRLIAHLDESWDQRRSLKTQLTKSVPVLQERSRETIKIALGLIKEGSRLEPVKAAA
jgi:polysaccharide pyruvyl transferase WcaK-like protein